MGLNLNCTSKTKIWETVQKIRIMIAKKEYNGKKGTEIVCFSTIMIKHYGI